MVSLSIINDVTQFKGLTKMLINYMIIYQGYSFIDSDKTISYHGQKYKLLKNKNIFHECTLFWKASTFEHVNEDVNVSLEDDFCVTNRPAKYNILYSAKLPIGRNNCFIV